MSNINLDLIEKFEKKYESNPVNKAVESAIFKNGLKQSSINNEAIKRHNFVFSHETKVGNITNQKASGRCWIFAGLNSVRTKLMEDFNIETLELSQNYVHFFDKLEKANFYLNWVENNGLELDNEDRLFRHFNASPISDGGYWEFFINLVRKYGIVTKDAMNESFSSEATNEMVEQINWRLKAYTAKMRQEFAKSKNINKVKALKENALEDVYNILVKSLGKPPKTFKFEYLDKDKKYVSLEEMTPVKFYEKYLSDYVDSKVNLVADPRNKFPHNSIIQAPLCNNMVGGVPLTMVNVDIEVMKKVMIEQIKAKEPVWFGCDVSTFGNRDGILDSELYNFDLTLTKTPEFSKAEKFESRASVIAHAMNMVGVNLDKNGNPINWKVENSWGADRGSKGFWSMSDQWFTDYNYMAIVDKKYLTPEILEAFNKPISTITPFDPLCDE
ncbi:C1 family peptidase [Mycoplasmopsis arginini]|uniref:C1 family peptidase n=1 Tax=Mycoplasmopsis arginini TaxID=2094 RepID=UPI0002D1586D|nr:C1 family peptidase [Mycoplasmopsis arginini]ENY69520.1 Aminopeptidase C [Mycoplasmopsis arginini 7264]